MVVWQGARLALLGVSIGVAAAAIVATAMQSLLFEIRALDPVTFGLATLLLATAALIASYIPARRAAGVSPLIALGKSS
jgi:putative ABC transport system permease protein